MKFEGTIVITDPCYLDNGMNNQDNLDLWEASNYGQDLSVFGCSQWISESTLYGDWSCTTLQSPEQQITLYIEALNNLYDIDSDINDPISKEVQEHINSAITILEESLGNFPTLGRFCADAGMVCVVYLDEITKVNPHFRKWAEEHYWCATIIEDFKGNVRYMLDNNDNAHIVGKGNIDFYTIQTGL